VAKGKAASRQQTMTRQAPIGSCHSHSMLLRAYYYIEGLHKPTVLASGDSGVLWSGLASESEWTGE
jgi:hypothetical protein